MIDGPIHVLTVAAAVGSGVVAGVFFAFSTFVMRALGRLPAPQGIAAMQAINVAAPTPPQNNALAAVDPSSGDGAHLWARYLKNWTAWNHARTLAPMVAAAVFVLAIRAG